MKKHNYDIGIVTKEATCTEDGEKQYVCLDCGNVYTELIPAAGHQHTEVKNKKAATCIGKGYTGDMYCMDCKTLILAGKEIVATGHSFDQGKVTKQATCKQNGIKTYTCKECRETKTETIPKTADHTWDRGKIIKDATCKEAGEKTYTCTICETKKAEVITRKTDHNWNHGNIIKAATCTKNGERVYTCLTCGERKKEVLPATGHHYGSWVNLLPATVFTSAQHRHICSKCGTSETLSYGRKIRPTIKLNASSLKLKVKQSTIKLTAGGLASGDYVRSWSTSNKKIVTVSKKANGKCRITAKKAGRAKVTVVLASGLKKTISVTVQKRDITCTSIKGVPKAITLIRKRSYQLRPQIFPITCTKKVSYISSKKKIVKVNSKGKITGGKKGSVKIIVKVGKKKFTCKVKVR